jgi:coatomer subunit beta'
LQENNGLLLDQTTHESVYNYNTSEKLKTISGEHTDFIRNLVVHPTLPYVLSCGDDDKILMFDWD